MSEQLTHDHLDTLIKKLRKSEHEKQIAHTAVIDAEGRVAACNKAVHMIETEIAKVIVTELQGVSAILRNDS